VTAERTSRSHALIQRKHLRRLVELADVQHAEFTRAGVRTNAWADRRVAVVLAQGGALHYLDKANGVKDLDVWTFYASLPSQRLRCGRYETHADFGPSEFGRQLYGPESGRVRQSWLAYEGRRVDFLVRELPVDPDAPHAEVSQALREWLTAGSRSKAKKKTTPWHLSRKAMIWLAPGKPGTVIWRPVPVNEFA
jgi:hypothetical protein